MTLAITIIRLLRIPRLFILLISMALLAPAALAQPASEEADAPVVAPANSAPHYYRWRDANGNLHFSDQKPTNVAGNVTKDTLHKAPKNGGGHKAMQAYRHINSLHQPYYTADGDSDEQPPTAPTERIKEEPQ